ncbi:MAG: Tol-Pal system protein TolR [Chlamydiales bacterium]|nr:Tol-Pal system protein TolR [Chlamydiales bacterium]MCH9635668.1 Tol-Pal system protein TolR [Chlamydiales bacterium]MCH9703561.1 biopolymer transporter ExbD [Chlamydiota bacterium]
MRELEESQINLTPLIDVVFVILIMFIVIAPILEMEGVDLAEGVGSQNRVEKVSRLSIHVHADDSITINKRPVALKQLATILEQAHARFPDEKLQLYQDKKATFGSYQAIKNLATRAGYEELDVILKPD